MSTESGGTHGATQPSTRSRDDVRNGEVEMTYIQSSQNEADVLTKSLKIEDHYRHRDGLGVLRYADSAVLAMMHGGHSAHASKKLVMMLFAMQLMKAQAEQQEPSHTDWIVFALHALGVMGGITILMYIVQMLKSIQYIFGGAKPAKPVKKKAKDVKHESSHASSEDEVRIDPAAVEVHPDHVFVTTTSTSHQGKYHVDENCRGLKTAKSVYKREACAYCCNTATEKIEEKDD